MTKGQVLGGGILVVAVLGSLWTAFADAAPGGVRRRPAPATRREPQAKDPDAGIAKPEPPPPPTVTSVYPIVGRPDSGTGDAGQAVKLFGTHFKPDSTKVLFGPGGVSGECRGVQVLSDSLLRCHLPGNIVPGEVEHFVVLSTFDGGAVSSDVSAAAYRLLPNPEVRDAGASGGEASPAVQMHVLGSNFGQAGDLPPTVTYTDAGGTTWYICDNVVLLNAGELICYVPRAIYDLLPHPLAFIVKPPRQ